MQNLPTLSASTSPVSGKRVWQPPLILLEFSLVAHAQGPMLGDDQFQKLEEDPFLGAFTASGT